MDSNLTLWATHTLSSSFLNKKKSVNGSDRRAAFLVGMMEQPAAAAAAAVVYASNAGLDSTLGAGVPCFDCRGTPWRPQTNHTMKQVGTPA